MLGWGVEVSESILFCSVEGSQSTLGEEDEKVSARVGDKSGSGKEDGDSE